MEVQTIDILLVEDNPGDAFLLQEQLKKNNSIRFNLVHVEYLQNAIAHLKQQSFDIVLLDLSLPDCHGIETFLQIQNTNSHIPVILLTGMDDKSLATESIHQGAQDYLIKGQTSGELIIRAMRYAIERKQNLEQLEQHVHELEGFSYMVSHDLKNPLTAIKGMSFLLSESYTEHQSETPEITRQKEYIEHIVKSCTQMEQIINDLTILSQIQHTQLEIGLFDLSALVEQIALRLQVRQPEHKVKFKIVPQVMASGHAPLLKIALENLLNNAWKYTTKKEHPYIEFGTLSLPVENLKLRFPHAQNFINQEESFTEDRPIYFIRDNGVGFDPQEADKLFLPFHRLHNRSEFSGTGIGLTIVKRIIELHEGKIWFDAEVDQGATFYFYFDKEAITV